MRIHRPSAPEEAYRLRKEIAGSAYLLGGTTVLTLGSEFEDLIDINGFIPGAITAEGSNVVIGAGAKLEDVASSGIVPPVIRTAAASCPSLLSSRSYRLYRFSASLYSLFFTLPALGHTLD